MAAASHEVFISTRTFGALDGLRALSVVAVIWQHTSGLPGPELFAKGYFGVDFFFAISGFLITTLLLREHRRNGSISLPNFYIRRFFRIFPLYYTVLAAYVFLVFLARRDTPEGDGFIANLPAFLTYTSNWFVDRADGDSVTFYFAWSLATEEQFYLFWPPALVILLMTLRRSTAPILVTLSILVAASQLAVAASFVNPAITILGSLSLPILLGAASACVVNDPRGFRILAPILGSRIAAPLLFASIIASLAFPTPEQLTQVLMVLAVTSVCMSEHTLLHPVLRWRPLVYVGVISYGIYLMHMLCANVIRTVTHEHFGVLLFLLTTALAIGVAALSFRMFEAPLLRLGRRFTSGEHTDAATRRQRASRVRSRFISRAPAANTQPIPPAHP